MRRVRSNLNDSGFAIVILAGANLFVLLCLCVLLTSYRSPRFGVSIRPAASHFSIERFDRSLSHIITITPGETSRYYAGDEEIPDGLLGVKHLLEKWKEAPVRPDSITVIIACDEAVSVGTVQKLADMIMQQGFTCAFYGCPATDE